MGGMAWVGKDKCGMEKNGCDGEGARELGARERERKGGEGEIGSRVGSDGEGRR